MIIRKSGLAAISMCVVLLFSCSKKRNDETGEALLPDKPKTEETVTVRQQLLTNIADQFIIPGYASFKIKLDFMDRKAIRFTGTPNQENLDSLRTAWKDAYTEWQKIAMFMVGPAETYVLNSYFNIFPATVSGIEANIANGNANLELPSNYSTQGFPALDYLLYGLGTDSATIAKYSTAPDAAKRSGYLLKITGFMKTTFNSVNNEWYSGYRARFVDNTAISSGSPLALLINSYVLYYERFIRSGKIGYPVNAMNDPAVARYPEKVEAYYSKNLSLTLVKTGHQAMVDVFTGKSFKSGKTVFSIKDYLNVMGATDSQTGIALSATIINQFQIVNSRLSGLSDNLAHQVENDYLKMVETYSAMQAAVRMLKVDMTSAMSIQITYTDNDGD